jgi:hypothetical protein
MDMKIQDMEHSMSHHHEKPYVKESLPKCSSYLKNIHFCSLSSPTLDEQPSLSRSPVISGVVRHTSMVWGGFVIALAAGSAAGAAALEPLAQRTQARQGQRGHLRSPRRIYEHFCDKWLYCQKFYQAHDKRSSSFFSK